MTAVRGSHRDWLEHHAGIRCFIWFKPSPLVASGTTTSVTSSEVLQEPRTTFTWCDLRYLLAWGVLGSMRTWAVFSWSWCFGGWRKQSGYCGCMTSELKKDEHMNVRFLKSSQTLEFRDKKKCLFDLVFLGNIHVKQFWSPDS